MRPLLIVALLALAACGADGPPARPTASVGVGVGSGGAFTTGAVGLAGDRFSLGLGF